MGAWATNSNNQMIFKRDVCACGGERRERRCRGTLANDSKVPHRSQDGARGLVGLSLRAAHLLYSWQLCVGTADETYGK